MKRKTVRTVALLGGIVLLVAGWWLLLEQAHDAVDEVVALQAAGDGDTARAPGFAAAADDDAAASGTAAEALPRETHVSSLEATRAPGGGSAPLDLLVTHAGGAPATGAVVVIGRDGTVLGKGVTDLAGRVRLVPSGGEADGAAGDAADGAADGAADVLIGGVSDEPVRRRLQSIAGEQTIVLPDGAVVEGRVLVDGAPPRQPLPLSLARADDPERDDVKRDKVWYALRTSWPGSSEWADVNSQIVGADGRFRFSGLQDKAWRFLGAGDAYAWEGDASSAAADGFPAQSEDAADPDRPSMEDKPWFLLAARLVRAPATGLVVRLRGMKRITGRVVEAQGGAPVPFASISFVQRWGSGNSTHASVPRCGADGRFVIALSVAREPVAALSLDIRHPEGRGSRQLEVGAEDCATGKDLGDIALDPALEVRVLVRDESGTPIAGAVAVSDDGRAQRSKPTDAEGRTALHVLPGTASISVWAARCYGQTVPLPPESLPGDELVVVLRRSPTLDVTVVRADGSSPEGLRMTLRCAQQLFDSAGRRGTGDRGFVPSGMVKHFGISIASFHPIPKEDGTAAEASGSMTIHLADEGHVRVDDLLPDVPFDLLVHDTYGGLVHEPQVIRLAPGEQRELRIVVTTTPRDLVLSVTDLQGAPLQASVENPVPATGNKDMWSTKADGRVTLSRLEGRDITLIVRSKGFADATLEHVAAPPDGSALTVALSPGRQVRLHVTDAHGHDVPAERISARDGRQRLVGRYLLDEPDAVARLAAPDAYAGRLVARASDHAASTPEDRSRWLLVELPAEPTTVEASVGGETFSAPCAAAQDEVEITVPLRGAAHVHWDQPLGTAGLAIVLRRTDEAAAPATVRRSPSPDEFLARDLLIPGLAPGTYEVRMLATNENGTTTLLAGPATANITAGDTTGVLLVAK